MSGTVLPAAVADAGRGGIAPGRPDPESLEAAARAVAATLRLFASCDECDDVDLPWAMMMLAGVLKHPEVVA